MRHLLARCCILTLAAGFAFAVEAPGFKITAKYPVAGDGGFDYIVLDGASNRLYVSHGTKVDVLDAGSGTLVGSIDDTPGVHGIAIVSSLHRGFTTNGGEATVSVFDTNTFKTLKKISVPKDPDFVFYDAQTKRVFVCHGDGAAITAIDPEKEEIAGKIDLGGGAEAALVDGKGTGYVNLEEAATVVSFDPQRLVVKNKWPITGCKTPTGLAMDVQSSRLFIGCRSKVLAVMNAKDGKIVSTVPIGDRVDAVAFDADNRLIFASNGDGTVTVIRQKGPNDYELIGDIRTEPSAKTMAFDPKSKRIYLSAAEMESVFSGSVQRSRMRPKPGTFHVLVVEKQ